MAKEEIFNVIEKYVIRPDENDELKPFHQFKRFIKILKKSSFTITEKMLADYVKKAGKRKPELMVRFLGYTLYIQIEEMNG